MLCPYCGHAEDKVVDSRSSDNNRAIRRRRECLRCGKRFTTYEHIEDMGLLVIKSDGRREAFDRGKMLSGLVKACNKRPVGMEVLESIVDDIERILHKTFDKEVSSNEIGELVMSHLQQLDEVAYVRFASVYRQFKDINQFVSELRELLDKPAKGAKKKSGIH
ncbi:MAG: transcriptional repressor NrdR [Candidatus Omnitrophica bacterium]|nr:transcriptional repressor NrdR [Candidatus Omnitrophota bacterium]